MYNTHTQHDIGSYISQYNTRLHKLQKKKVFISY